VYAAGYKEDTYEVKYAGYWKNGSWTALSDGTTDAMALSLFVDGVD